MGRRRLGELQTDPSYSPAKGAFQLVNPAAVASDPAVGKLLGAGKEAEVFEYGAQVLRLYKPTASKGRAEGVPAEADGLMEMAEAL